jgi:RHS repeat-associated protein
MSYWTHDGKTTTYTWDAAGNRTKAGTATATYDARNRLLNDGSATYTYTPRGTLNTVTKAANARTLTFDAFERKITDGASTYIYDSLDRVAKHGTTAFRYDGGSNNLLGDGTTDYSRTPSGALLASTNSTITQWSLTDQHTDLVAGLSTDGLHVTGSTAYDPFGTTTATEGGMPNVGYQSGWTDPANGDVNMAARWYQADTGSFASRDTWQLEPDPSGQANRYSYGLGGPLNGTDPTGHCVGPVLVICVGAGAEALGWGTLAGVTGTGIGWGIWEWTHWDSGTTTTTSTYAHSNVWSYPWARSAASLVAAQADALAANAWKGSSALVDTGTGKYTYGCTYSCRASAVSTTVPRTVTPPRPIIDQNPNNGKSPKPATDRPAPKPDWDPNQGGWQPGDGWTVIISALKMLSANNVQQYTPDQQVSHASVSSQDSGQKTGTDGKKEEDCTTHLQKTRAERGMSGIVCFRAPKGATKDQINELKDHIAALNAVPSYWSTKGRVSPRNEDVVGPDGKIATLEKTAEKIKAKHIRSVDGTAYEYKNTVAGHLPDTTWSGKQSPYCWHQQDGDVNSRVGAYAQKYSVGYRPTGFYYAGVEKDASTYTTQRITGKVSRGPHNICQISRP